MADFLDIFLKAILIFVLYFSCLFSYLKMLGRVATISKQNSNTTKKWPGSTTYTSSYNLRLRVIMNLNSIR